MSRKCKVREVEVVVVVVHLFFGVNDTKNAYDFNSLLI